MLRVLTIDEHAIVRDGVKKVFHNYPTAVVFGEASSGEQALRLLRDQDWDIVILEIGLEPGGFVLLKEITAVRPLLPILVLSSHSEEQYARRAFRAGAGGYVTKDSPITELQEAVQRVLVGRVYASSDITEQLVANLANREKRPGLETLSDREFEVLRLMAAGNTVTEIGRLLSLSDKTISTYRARLMQKLGLKSNAALIHYAIRRKLVD